MGGDTPSHTLPCSGFAGMQRAAKSMRGPPRLHAPPTFHFPPTSNVNDTLHHAWHTDNTGSAIMHQASGVSMTDCQGKVYSGTCWEAFAWCRFAWPCAGMDAFVRISSVEDGVANIRSADSLYCRYMWTLPARLCLYPPIPWWLFSVPENSHWNVEAYWPSHAACATVNWTPWCSHAPTRWTFKVVSSTNGQWWQWTSH